MKISCWEAMGPISLSANIADMYYSIANLCDSDPKILDTFDIFKDCSLQSIYIAWIFSLLFGSYCI